MDRRQLSGVIGFGRCLPTHDKATSSLPFEALGRQNLDSESAEPDIVPFAAGQQADGGNSEGASSGCERVDGGHPNELGYRALAGFPASQLDNSDQDGSCQ
jgi:hypothetical protein